MSADEQELLRQRVRTQLCEIVAGVNATLTGKNLEPLAPILARIGRGGVLPHWYPELLRNGALPNLDGKTIGSVVEMLFVAVVEQHFIADITKAKLRINPARGVDLPDLNLGVKSPSENFCTSEPFYSAYERLLGSEYDIVVFITDYQNAKARPPLRLQILHARYLEKTQIADENLCALARKHREWLIAEGEARAKKFLRFLAYVNQSDWLARQLVRLLDILNDAAQIDTAIAVAEREFRRLNERLLRASRPGMPDADLESLVNIRKIEPRHVGVIDAADDWVLETWKEASRAPSDNEWQRLKSGPLNGVIGMSFALQWRYNFGRLFGAQSDAID